MKDLTENRNIFTINGYLSRKWYFILGFSVASANFILIMFLCKELLLKIIELSKANTGYSVIGLLTSGAIPPEELYAYIVLYVASAILSFINNKKRITDILGDEKYSYLIAAIFTALSVAIAFTASNSILYSIILLFVMIGSFSLLCFPGKITNRDTEQIECENGEVETKKVVSFWKRWFAYIIDATFILGGILSCVAVVLPDSFLKIGDYSILIGILFTLLYFGIMNSEICKGQTLGKSFTGLKVVDKYGNYLTLTQSLIRTLILIICLTLPYMFIAKMSVSIPSPDEAYFVIAAITAGIIFDLLFLFNVKTRQTLHDLAVGSYVIDKKYNCWLKDNKISTTPIVLAIIPAILIALPLFAGNTKRAQNLKNPESVSYKEAQFAQKMEQDLNVKINRDQAVSLKNSSLHLVSVSAVNINDEELANRIKDYINTNIQSKPDKVTVILQRTINLGNVVTTTQKAYNFEENSPNGLDK